MQQAWKKWIIIVSIVLVAALFFLFYHMEKTPPHTG